MVFAKIIEFQQNITAIRLEVSAWESLCVQLVCGECGRKTCFNIKMSYQYRNSHHEDKMAIKLSYLYNGNPYTWKDGLYIEIGAHNGPLNEPAPFDLPELIFQAKVTKFGT